MKFIKSIVIFLSCIASCFRLQANFSAGLQLSVKCGNTEEAAIKHNLFCTYTQQNINSEASINLHQDTINAHIKAYSTHKQNNSEHRKPASVDANLGEIKLETIATFARKGFNIITPICINALKSLDKKQIEEINKNKQLFPVFLKMHQPRIKNKKWYKTIPDISISYEADNFSEFGDIQIKLGSNLIVFDSQDALKALELEKDTAIIRENTKKIWSEIFDLYEQHKI